MTIKGKALTPLQKAHQKIKHRRIVAEYDWKQLNIYIMREFDHDDYDVFTSTMNYDLESDIWSFLFDLVPPSSTEGYKAFQYLYYAICMNQRPWITMNKIKLTDKQNKAVKYAINKSLTFTRQGALKQVTKYIKEIRRKYKKSLGKPKYDV